jgi:hypothetical protein
MARDLSLYTRGSRFDSQIHCKKKRGRKIIKLQDDQMWAKNPYN